MVQNTSPWLSVGLIELLLGEEVDAYRVHSAVAELKEQLTKSTVENARLRKEMTERAEVVALQLSGAVLNRLFSFCFILIH